MADVDPEDPNNSYANELDDDAERAEMVAETAEMQEWAQVMMRFSKMYLKQYLIMRSCTIILWSNRWTQNKSKRSWMGFRMDHQ